VDPVSDPLLFFGSAGNRTRASGSVAKKQHNKTGLISSTYILIVNYEQCNSSFISMTA
jgi:hypothetical protein